MESFLSVPTKSELETLFPKKIPAKCFYPIQKVNFVESFLNQLSVTFKAGCEAEDQWLTTASDAKKQIIK